MKKVKLLLFLGCLCWILRIEDVFALTNEERKEVMLEQLNNYQFDFKYVDMSDNYKFIFDNATGLREDITFEEIYDSYESTFLSGLVRNELENIIDLNNNDGIDLFCYLEGDEYTVYTDEGSYNTVREHDGCSVAIYLDWFTPEKVDFQVEILGDFTLVEGNTETKREVFSIVKEMIGNVSVADVDILNHYMNYKSSSSTFFEGNNALLEFASLKKIVEENPDYNFFVSYSDTRAGAQYVSLANGSTFVEKDGVVYGFSNNRYISGNMFFVPVGTELSKYGEVLEQRLKDYVNDDDVSIEVLPYDSNIVFNVAKFPNNNIGWILEDEMGISVHEYYEKVGTNLEKEKNKIDEENWQDCTNCVAMQTYQLIVNGEKYEIGITEMYDEVLNKFGTVLSKDVNSGIILKTNAGNIPLDAKLIVESFELWKKELDKLNSLGYSKIDSYNFQIYSTILDKIISEFTNVTDILIPINSSWDDDLKIIYLSDDLNTIEYYDTKLVDYMGEEYLQFSTNHFSNYVLVKADEIINPDTSDNIMTYIILLIVSIGLFVGLFWFYKKNK